MTDLTTIAISSIENVDDSRPINLPRLINELKSMQEQKPAQITDNYQLLDWLSEFSTDQQALNAIDDFINQARQNHRLTHRYQTIERLTKLGAQVELTKLANQQLLSPGGNLMYSRHIRAIIALDTTTELHPIVNGDLIQRIQTLSHQSERKLNL